MSRKLENAKKIIYFNISKDSNKYNYKLFFYRANKVYIVIIYVVNIIIM